MELVETCSWYDVAPRELFQLNAGFVEIPVALFAGETSVGAGGGTGSVVKFHIVDHPLVPLAFVAFTRQ